MLKNSFRLHQNQFRLRAMFTALILIVIVVACSDDDDSEGEAPVPISPDSQTIAPRNDRRTLELSDVNDFVYQLQNIDLTAIGSTAYDLVVMDYSADGGDDERFTKSEIEALKRSPGGDKIVLAYMSIGEAEDYRFYWQGDWKPGSPAWVDSVNPDWAGNFKVRYWEAEWESIIFDYLDRIVDAGFDGVYLDIISAYEFFTDKGRDTAAQEMVGFVESIAVHARNRNPNFYIFPQNHPELADIIPSYLDIVDGIGQEDIYYGYESDNKATPADTTAELERYLNLFKNAGKLVLTVDYASKLDNVSDAYAQSGANGYVPFATVRDLDKLTVNAGFEPD